LEFHSFQSRLLFFFITLLSLALVATHLFVDLASKSNAGQVISENLKTGARIFNKLMDGRFRQLSESAWLLSGDYAFKLAYSTQDYPTVLSALANHRDRIGADSMALISMDGQMLADTRTGAVKPAPYPHPDLLNAAANEGAAHSMVIIDGKTYQTIIVPLLAPDTVAWISIGFLVDEKLAVELKSLTGLEVSFFIERKESWEPIASTIAGRLPPPSQLMMTGEAGKEPVIHEASFSDNTWLTLGIPLGHPPGADYKITAILQYSLAKALEPYKRLRATLLLIGGAGLAVSALAGIFLSRTVSRPVQLLMKQVQSIERGDYSARVSVKRRDEIGALANAVNNMAHGLEEKDKMRSLLGKVVSPAVAEELLSKKLELGGEEREMTILFSDIRSFTTISERMTPNETLTLLNIYLTTMAAIIDKHGGVVTNSSATRSWLFSALRPRTRTTQTAPCSPRWKWFRLLRSST
jgi:adenylate cyclase